MIIEGPASPFAGLSPFYAMIQNQLMTSSSTADSGRFFEAMLMRKT